MHVHGGGWPPTDEVTRRLPALVHDCSPKAAAAGPFWLPSPLPRTHATCSLGFVTADVESLLREALALPDQDRADIATELLASLDCEADEDPATVERLWRGELQARAQRVLSGDTTEEDWSALRQRLTNRLPE